MDSPTARAQPFWASLPPADRARYLRRAGQVVLDVADELVGFLGRERGRTPGAAWTLDVLPAVDGLHWAARAGVRVLGPERIPRLTPLARTRRATLVRRPVGVVAVRGSDGWADLVERTGVALMAGNGALVEAGSAGERVMRIFERAGLPERIVSVAGEDELAAASLDWRPAPREPGPMLVLADADVARAAAAAAWAAGGSLSEVVVARDVAEAFDARLSAHGAAPPVTRVTGLEEALERAAGAGPAAVVSLWTADGERAERIAADLRAPVVWINDHGAPVGARSPLLFDAVTVPGVVAGGGWAPWWPPAVPGLERGLRSAGTLLYGRESDRAAALRDGSRPLVSVLGRLRRPR